MSDVSRYLPLSQRPHRDESHVTRDRAEDIRSVAESVRRAVADAPQLPESSRDTLDRILTLADRAQQASAAGRRGRHARTATSVRILTDVLLDAWTLSDTLVAPLEIDSTLTARVALDLAVAARHPVRAVVRGRTLVASDAGWSFGHGPELRGTARELIELLAGRAATPTGRRTRDRGKEDPQ